MKSSLASTTRRDWLIVTTLFVVTLLSRIPFRTTLLYAWDSVLYTRAIEDFNVTVHHPQPPGHIFYVGLVWLINRLLDNPNSAMVWISAVAAAGAVASLYWLGRLMFSPRVGILAALLLGSSTSFWAYSEVAYPYTLLCFLGILSALGIYQLWEGKAGWVFPASLVLGLAGGFRADLLFFMLPLLLVGIAINGLSRPGWWRLALAALVLGLTTAAWYVPAALLSGGFSAFRGASSLQSDYLITYFSVFGKGWTAVRSNLHMLLRFNVLGLAAAIPLLALFAGTLAGRRPRPASKDKRFWFLAMWITPSLAFYIFIHVGEYGYIFTYLPALMLAAAWGLARFFPQQRTENGGASDRQQASDSEPGYRGLPGGKSGYRGLPDSEPGYRGLPGGKSGRYAHLFMLFAGVLVAINLLLFLFLSTPLSAGRLAARDEILRCRIDTIKERFDPASTLVVSVFDYEIAAYYLPGFTHWHFDQAIENHPDTPVGREIRNVVAFEEFLQPEDPRAASVIDICREQSLYYLPLPGPGTIRVDWDTRTMGFDGAS